MKFTRKGERNTHVEFVSEAVLGVFCSDKATKAWMKKRLFEVGGIQRYYDCMIGIDSITDKVGGNLGHMLAWDGMGGAKSKEERAKEVEEVIKKSKALSAVKDKYPWIVILMHRAREGALAANHSISTKIEVIEEEEARIIGNNLMSALKSRKLIAAGVDHWRKQNRAIDELLTEFPWMRALFEALGQGVVKTAPWGMMWRVGLGAVLSTLDLVTDIYITYIFWKEGEEKEVFFQFNVAMLGTSMLLSFFMVILQHRKRGWVNTLLEVVIVVLGLKPAIDAFRVATSKKKEHGQILDPISEMNFLKMIEIFSESIPGAIIQLSAILSDDSGHISNAAIVSLAISALTTGFTSATVSYDVDTEPQKRIESPGFYGYVPDDPRRRTVVFVSLLLLSAVMLLVRALVIVMLGLVSYSAALIFVGTDIGLFILVKVIRDDFTYWIPIYGCLGAAFSFIERIMVKVIVDFTNNVHLRSPNEVGGAHWLFCFFCSLVSLPVATLYYEKMVGNANVVRMATSSALVLLPMSISMIVIFFITIKSGYRRTFLSTRRGKDVTISHFDSSEDSVKALVFIKHSSHWKKIEDKVTFWVQENWERWMDEQPDWLDDYVKSSIPPHMIPNPEDQEAARASASGATGTGAGRRSSVKASGNLSKSAQQQQQQQASGGSARKRLMDRVRVAPKIDNALDRIAKGFTASENDALRSF